MFGSGVGVVVLPHRWYRGCGGWRCRPWRQAAGQACSAPVGQRRAGGTTTSNRDFTKRYATCTPHTTGYQCLFASMLDPIPHEGGNRGRRRSRQCGVLASPVSKSRNFIGSSEPRQCCLRSTLTAAMMAGLDEGGRRQGPKTTHLTRVCSGGDMASTDRRVNGSPVVVPCSWNNRVSCVVCCCRTFAACPPTSCRYCTLIA